MKVLMSLRQRPRQQLRPWTRVGGGHGEYAARRLSASDHGGKCGALEGFRSGLKGVIHTVQNEWRRRARAEAIMSKTGRSSSAALFVDAAHYWKKDAYVVNVVIEKGCPVNAATVITRLTYDAERLAIAIALPERRSDVTIFSDSRTAIRSISIGFVSTTAAHITSKIPTQENKVEVPLTHNAWIPAHMGFFF
ncbi:hypothetical protein HPB51_016593 [Rhipicephalus microplus]|uniref:Tick transposon n=1 Tax=Rhipicephalus microplus TaxID=6941 RepID=A0A9J6E2E8_RHIMP|nr:hypothetical protein HPB51_016593 [Rhipicephalus microplus]